MKNEILKKIVLGLHIGIILLDLNTSRKKYCLIQILKIPKTGLNIIKSKVSTKQEEN
jgi:hypothetical protein